jgi:SAM-dependent methyltransferase
LYLRLARQHEIVAGTGVIAEYRRHDNNMSADHPMMLAAAMRVVRAQAPHVAGKPHLERALMKGLANWKGYFARQQLLAVSDALGRPSRLPRELRRLGRLAPSIPFTILRESMLEMLARVRARVRTGTIDFGDLRRTSPLSRYFGYDRGTPVDRHYIEEFLARHAADIRGRVLEVGDNAYTVRFGGTRVAQSEVVHIDPKAPNVTYCTDLTHGTGIPDGVFDCVVLTQTLQLLFDLAKTVETLDRILKPGGVLLITAPGVSSVDRGEWGSTWFWSFTPASMRRLMEQRFGGTSVEVTSYGNVLTAAAFLYGLAGNELRPHELDVPDEQYPVIVAARVVKASR